MATARWGANYFPNVPLVTHEGRTVRFFDDLIRGKVVVINFIYTRCPDACPLETAKLAEVQTILGDRVGSDTFFYTISIDPTHDSPAVMRQYAETYGAGPGWLFLTGRASDISLLRQRLGLYDPSAETNLSQHSLSILMGNQATGRWMKSSPLENSHVLATRIGDWLHNWKRPRDPERDFSKAPKLRNITTGESLFRTRCASCHVIGSADRQVLQVGPDLLGVTDRRDPEWLRRWLMEPDAMLAEKDPTAMQLFAAYRHVPMPNMRLNRLEADQLLGFLRTETLRVRSTQRAAATQDGLQPEAPPACCQKKTSSVLESNSSRGRLRRLWAPLPLLSIGLGLALGVWAAILGKRLVRAGTTGRR